MMCHKEEDTTPFRLTLKKNSPRLSVLDEKDIGGEVQKINYCHMQFNEWRQGFLMIVEHEECC
jgi:hypothetical protein